MCHGFGYVATDLTWSSPYVELSIAVVVALSQCKMTSGEMQNSIGPSSAVESEWVVLLGGDTFSLVDTDMDRYGDSVKPLFIVGLDPFAIKL